MAGFFARDRDNLTEKMRRGKSSFNNLPFEILIQDGVSEVAKFDRMQDKNRVLQFNRDVQDWATQTTEKLKQSVKSLIDKDLFLSESIKPKVYYNNKYGKEANRVGFSFAREGIYVHKGAGKGQGGYRGSTWRNIHGQEKKTLTSSLTLMGSGNRQPKEWFNPVIEKELEVLADIVTAYSSDLHMDATRIYIK